MCVCEGVRVLVCVGEGGVWEWEGWCVCGGVGGKGGVYKYSCKSNSSQKPYKYSCKSNSSQKPATNYLLLRDINSCSQVQYVEILIG